MASAPTPALQAGRALEGTRCGRVPQRSVAPTFPGGDPSGRRIGRSGVGRGRRRTDASPPTLPAGLEGAPEDSGGDVSTTAARGVGGVLAGLRRTQEVPALGGRRRGLRWYHLLPSLKS